MTYPEPIIIDISEWQKPHKINYELLSKTVSGVIVRVQYGSYREDLYYKEHIENLKKYNVPFGVYAWVRGISYEDMEKEAIDFYNRCYHYEPSFYWLDVEELSMNDMRQGINRFKNKLKELGAEKVGVYVAHHLFYNVNPQLENFDGVWIPYYGSNSGNYHSGKPTVTNNYNIVQYTSKGRLSFYGDELDLNELVNGNFDYFFSKNSNSGYTQNEKEGLKKMEIITTVDGVKLRNAPILTNDSIISELPKNTTIIINKIVQMNGFVWGEQPRLDGSTGYIDIGKSVDYIKFN